MAQEQIQAETQNTDKLAEAENAKNFGESSGAVAPNLDNELDTALSKSFGSEPAKEVQPEQKPSKVEKEVKKDPIIPKADLPDPDSITDPVLKGDKNKEGWNALKNNYKTAHREAMESKAQIEKLQATLAEKGSLTTKETAALKSEIEELSRYRAMVDIQADPEFVSKYDQPIQNTVGSIKEMLRGMEVSDDIVNQIDFTNTKLMDEIIGYVGTHRDKFLARKLERKVEELMGLSDQRNDTLSKHKNDYKEYVENKKKEVYTRGQEEQGRMTMHLQAIREAKGEDKNLMFPFLSKITPADNATEAEKAQIANHNSVADIMNNMVQQGLKATSPEDRTKLAVSAATERYVRAQFNNALKKIASLEEELAKISNVSTESTKVKNRTAPRSDNGQFSSNGEGADVDSALSNYFAKR